MQRSVSEQVKLMKIHSPVAAKDILKHSVSINVFILEVGFLNIDLLFYSQYLLMKMTRMILCGF